MSDQVYCIYFLQAYLILVLLNAFRGLIERGLNKFLLLKGGLIGEGGLIERGA